MKRKGFTLAEVLVTLTIIGVIAAMTIPTLIRSTGDQEYKTGCKKAFSTLEQIIAVNAVAGELQSTEDIMGATLTTLLNAKMATIATPTSNIPDIDCTNTAENLTASGSNSNNWVYTTDNFRYYVVGEGTGQVVVDTNGNKGPNRCMLIETSEEDCQRAKVKTQGDSFIFQVNNTPGSLTAYKEFYPTREASCIIYGYESL